jgi:N-carbamoyl-L-amino-acid hydrolase
MTSSLDTRRTIRELQELRRLTADDNGAQRVAFTPMWVQTREWLKSKLATLPVETHVDAAGNMWSTLKGR